MKIVLAAVVAVALAAVVAIGSRSTPRSRDVFTLVSNAITMPFEDQSLPAGPHVDIVNANCMACHSAGMILNQPPLSADQWKATVIKMREVYKAPIADEDMPAILSYLNARSAALARKEIDLAGKRAGQSID